MTMVASAARWEPLLQGGFHPRRWLPLLQGGFHRSGRKDINPIPESGERLTFAGRLPLAKMYYIFNQLQRRLNKSI